MSFSSRRRNYLLTPHRRDGLIEWMKEMLMHSFVLDALDETGADTFSHFEMLIEEHRAMTDDDNNKNNSSNSSNSNSNSNNKGPSRLRRLVPTVGSFHTRLPLRRAFVAYNAKYAVTSRRHLCISFNEIRHILNLAQIMAFSDKHENGDGESDRGATKKNTTTTTTTGGDENLVTPRRDDDDDDAIARDWRADESPSLFPRPSAQEIPGLPALGTSSTTTTTTAPFSGPKMISFDGDQTLYSDGANFESNPKLANYLYMLLRHGVTVAVVTAAGYEYQTHKYELRLSGLLAFFREMKLSEEDCARFYLFGGECNYLLNLGPDYKLHPVKEHGPGGWITSTAHLPEAPANWNDAAVDRLLDAAEDIFRDSRRVQRLRARVVRKRRSVGLVPENDERLPREALDETVLRVQAALATEDTNLPFCAFNGGRDCWLDVGNKRVGVDVLRSYTGIVSPAETLHIGDQFLNTGNDTAARDVCPCVWITSPEETTYILKSLLRLAGLSVTSSIATKQTKEETETETENGGAKTGVRLDFKEMERRSTAVMMMDVYTGEMREVKKKPCL